MSRELGILADEAGVDVTRARREDILALRKPLEFNDGVTVDSFKDETDINKIIAKAQRTGTISHMAAHQAEYGDFAQFDFMEAQLQIAKGVQIFDELPSEVRREFGNDPGAFFSFVNDPANKDRLEEVLPKIAESGRYFPNPAKRTAPPVSDTAREASPTPSPAEPASPPADLRVQDPPEAAGEPT